MQVGNLRKEIFRQHDQLLTPFYGPTTPAAFINLIEAWTTETVVQWIKGLCIVVNTGLYRQKQDPILTDQANARYSFLGIADCVNPFLDQLTKAHVDGRTLLIMDEDYLQKIGVQSFGARRTIMQAVELLTHLCYHLHNENLQSLAMTVIISTGEAINTMRLASSVFDRARNQLDHAQEQIRTKLIATINAIRVTVLRVIEDLKKLIFWFDRSPFDRIAPYVQLRNQLMDYGQALLKAVNVSSKQMLLASAMLIEKGQQLNKICEYIVRELNDPLILYTAYLERAVLKRNNTGTEWGVNLQSTYLGVHVISEVKLQSPADNCGKVDAGDEILQINGQTVIGWDLSQVAKKLFTTSTDPHAALEMVLLLKKRPREMVATTLPFYINNNKSQPGTPKSQPRSPGRMFLKMTTPGSQTTANFEQLAARAGAELQQQQSSEEWSKYRRRSSSLSIDKSIAGSSKRMPLIQITTPKSPTDILIPLEKSLSYRSRHSSRSPASRRRASICGGSPPPVRYQCHNMLAATTKFRNATGVNNSEKASSVPPGSPLDQLPIPYSARPHSTSAVEPTTPTSTSGGGGGGAGDDTPPVGMRRTHTMRQQPDGFVKSFIDNRFIDELEDNVILDADRLPVDDEEDVFADSEHNDFGDSITFSQVDVVNEAELTRLNLPPVNTKDTEWNLQPSSAMRSRCPTIAEEGSRPASQAGVNAGKPPASPGIIHTPLRLKSREKLYSFFGEPIPSSSGNMSMSWAPGDNNAMTASGLSISITDFDEERASLSNVSARENLLEEFARQPCWSIDGKRYEGFVRRRRFAGERISTADRSNKWQKCWLVLKDSLLYVYQSQLDVEAIIVIALVGFTVCDSPELKSTKKNVFRITRDQTTFHFACYTAQDMKNWMNNLGLSAICCDQTDEEKRRGRLLAQSGYYVNSKLLPVENYAGCPPSPAPHTTHYTLPRMADIFGGKPSRRRGINLIDRQASNSSLPRNLPSNSMRTSTSTTGGEASPSPSTAKSFGSTTASSPLGFKNEQTKL